MKNPIKVAVGVILVALFGVLAIYSMPVQLSPDVQVPKITISSVWPGAAPREIEKEIIREQEILAQFPYWADLYPILQNTVTRPSTVSGESYNEVSTAFFTSVHSVLTGESDAATALELLELDLQEIMGE